MMYSEHKVDKHQGQNKSISIDTRVGWCFSIKLQETIGIRNPFTEG